MEGPSRIRTAYKKVEYQGNVVGEPARFKRKLELVSVIDVSVEVRFKVSRRLIWWRALGVNRCPGGRWRRLGTGNQFIGDALGNLALQGTRGQREQKVDGGAGPPWDPRGR